MIKILLGVDAFPIAFKDIESGIYFVECKMPEAAGMGRVQIMLDTNVVSSVTCDPHVFMQKVGWYFGGGCEIFLNPSMSIVEQYLSNSADCARSNLLRFEEAVREYQMFDAGYADSMLRHAMLNEQSLRQVVGISFCYLSVLRDIYFCKDKDGIDKWVEFFSQDIPRLQVLYIVGSVFLMSKEYRSARFLGGGGKIDDFANGFFSYRKHELDDFSRWLRNRTFDILYFMAAPILGITELMGSRAVVVSKDKFVGEFIGRLIAWGGDQKTDQHWLLFPQMHTIDQSDPRISSFMTKIGGGVASARAPSDCGNKDRVKNLIEFSLAHVDSDISRGLHRALTEYRVYDLL